MTAWCVVAPGPSACRLDVQKAAATGYKIGAAGCAFYLAPDAEFVASSDAAWWRKYPDAMKAKARYSMLEVEGCSRVKVGGKLICNSGVLALEVAKLKGATRIIMLGFDMRGDHFFGPYTNGLTNTAAGQRSKHFQQFEDWAKANREIEVINCTRGSALKTFTMGSLDDFCCHV